MSETDNCQWLCGVLCEKINAHLCEQEISHIIHLSSLFCAIVLHHIVMADVVAPEIYHY